MLLVWLYHPPKHPRGIPWNQALRELDYVGAILFTIGAVLVFTGVIYTTIIPPSDPIVLGTLVSGFAVIVAFALWEHFMPLKQALTPPHIFAKDKGREFTYPFIAGTIVNMFFYSVNIAYPTAVCWLFLSVASCHKACLTGLLSDQCSLDHTRDLSFILHPTHFATELGSDLWFHVVMVLWVSIISPAAMPSRPEDLTPMQYQDWALEVAVHPLVRRNDPLWRPTCPCHAQQHGHDHGLLFYLRGSVRLGADPLHYLDPVRCPAG
jgi:hypothetical protein